MGSAGKSPKPSGLRRGAEPSRKRRDPDETDPGALLPEFSDDEVEEISSADGLVNDVDEIGPGEKTQVYDANAHADPSAASFKFIVVAGPKAGAEYKLGEEEITLGRGADNGISIPDVSVSRKHIRISRDGDAGYLVTDLGSGNGTRINDQKVASQTMRHGDEVAVGDSVLQLVEIGAPAVKKGRAARAPAPRSAETAAPTAPTRGEVARVAPARAAQAPPNARKRIYLVVGVIFVVFIGLGLVRKSRQAREAAVLAKAGADETGGVSAVDLATEARKLAKRHQWIAALAKFEAAYEQGGDAGLERFIEGAKTEAAHERRLNDAKAALTRGDFAAAKSGIDAVPEQADVFPQAKEAARQLEIALDRGVSEARGLAGSDKDKARDLVARILDVDPANAAALTLRSELDRKVVARASALRVTVAKRAEAPKKEAPASGPAIAAYLAGDLPRALRAAEESDDAKLLKQLRAFDVNYREGIARAQAQRPPEAVKALGTAVRIDRELAQGRPSKPGKEVSRQLANMEYLLGLDCKGDDQLDCSARHFRAALDADSEHELSKKMTLKIYSRAKELYTEAYLIKSTEPERAKKMFKKVVDTLPESEETKAKAQRWFEKLDGQRSSTE